MAWEYRCLTGASHHSLSLRMEQVPTLNNKFCFKYLSPSHRKVGAQLATGYPSNKPILLYSSVSQWQVAATNHVMYTVEVLWSKIFVSVTEFTHRGKLHKFKLISFCATCFRVKTGSRRQRCLQTFFSKHKAIYYYWCVAVACHPNVW